MSICCDCVCLHTHNQHVFTAIVSSCQLNAIVLECISLFRARLARLHKYLVSNPLGKTNDVILHIFHLQYLNVLYGKIFEFDPPSVLTEKLKHALAAGPFAYANDAESFGVSPPRCVAGVRDKTSRVFAAVRAKSGPSTFLTRLSFLPSVWSNEGEGHFSESSRVASSQSTALTDVPPSQYLVARCARM